MQQRRRFQRHRQLFVGAHDEQTHARPVSRYFADAGGIAKPYAFDPSLFNYGELKVPKDVQYPTGYTGFRVIAPDAMLQFPLA